MDSTTSKPGADQGNTTVQLLDDRPSEDLRHEVARSRRRQQWRWGLLVTAVLLLLSVFSGGFFLYATMVVGVLFGLSVGLTSLSLLNLEVRRSLSSEQVLFGETVKVHLAIRNRKPWPALWLFFRDQVDLGLDLEGPSCGFKTLHQEEATKLSYRLHSTRRGIFRIGPVVMEASGPFGLVRRFLVDREAGFLTVLPRTVDIGRGWPLGHRPIHEVPRRRSLFEDPTRFLGIREYRPGDGLRRVHWRATARSGKLQVKVFEPSVLEGLLLAVEMGAEAYGTAEERGPYGDPQEELAITTAASLAEFALAGSQSVGLLSNGADDAERFDQDWTGGTFQRLEEALDAVETHRKANVYRPLEVVPGKGSVQLDRLRTALARLTPASGLSLPKLLSLELPRLPRSLVLMVVTPRVDGALGSTLAALKRSGFEVAVAWIGARLDGTAARSLPEGIPLYAVRNEQDLEALGGQRL